MAKGPIRRGGIGREVRETLGQKQVTAEITLEMMRTQAYPSTAPRGCVEVGVGAGVGSMGASFQSFGQTSSTMPARRNCLLRGATSRQRRNYSVLGCLPTRRWAHYFQPRALTRGRSYGAVARWYTTRLPTALGTLTPGLAHPFLTSHVAQGRS